MEMKKDWHSWEGEEKKRGMKISEVEGLELAVLDDEGCHMTLCLPCLPQPLIVPSHCLYCLRCLYCLYSILSLN